MPVREPQKPESGSGDLSCFCSIFYCRLIDSVEVFLVEPSSPDLLSARKLVGTSWATLHPCAKALPHVHVYVLATAALELLSRTVVCIVFRQRLGPPRAVLLGVMKRRRVRENNMMRKTNGFPGLFPGGSRSTVEAHDAGGYTRNAVVRDKRRRVDSVFAQGPLHVSTLQPHPSSLKTHQHT